MSSISALGPNEYNHASPLQQLEAELQSEVSAGSISSSDQSALSSALTSIDSSLTADQSSAQSAGSTDGSGGTGPHDIRAKIDSLIQAQVSSGALTSSQATELKNLFANTFGNGPGGQGDFGGAGGPGGPQGFGGPPPGPPPSGGSASGSLTDQLPSSSSSTDASSGDSSSGDSTSLSTVLQDFLKLLQDAQSYSYGANGATAPSGASASTLINYQA